MFHGDSLVVSGEIGRDSQGLSGFFLFKIDTLGNIGSLSTFKDPMLEDHALLDGRNPMFQDEQGGFTMGGVFLHRDDLFVLKLNNDLNSIFYKEYILNYPTLYIEDIESLFQDYYLVGIVQTSNGDQDVFVQKIDSLGNKIWEKTYGIPTKDETGRAAIIENDGLTIMVSESFDNTPNIKNDTRYWIRFMHIDTSGAIIRDWKEEVTGEEGWSGSLVKLNTDYLYTTNQLGEEYGFGYFQAGQVVRRDQDFNLVWRKSYGEPDNYFNGLGDMIISADSNLLVTGQILDESQKFELQRMMKICPDGDIIWEVRDTGIILDNGESLNFMEGIAASSCNSTYAVGYTYKSAGFYEGLILKVSGDGCIDTLCTTTDIDNHIQLEEKKILFYPNPVNSELHIMLSDEVPLPVLLRLYNAYGQLLTSTNVEEYSSSIDLSHFPDGLFYLVTDSKGQVIATKSILKLE